MFFIIIFIIYREVCKAFDSLFFSHEHIQQIRIPLFGVPLESIIERQLKDPNPPEYLVPVFVHNIIEYLKNSCMDVEGLFRISGSNQDVERLKHVFEQGAVIDLSQIDPHGLTALLKCFIRELPEPIVPSPVSSWANDLLSKKKIFILLYIIFYCMYFF